MESQDHYGILGVDQRATDVEIKRAYRRLARRLHPDVTNDPDGERKFKAVAEAYRTLRRLDSRTAYDHQVLPVAFGTALNWNLSPHLVWFPLFQWPVWVWYWTI